jgi:hypothetical protein
VDSGCYIVHGDRANELKKQAETER